MKAVILAGGLGTRISEESLTKPKPMIEIGGRPLLWHIMKIYFHQGVREFLIALGNKGSVIKEFFADYPLAISDVTFRGDGGEIELLSHRREAWTVTLVDTGDETQTGGRLKRLRDYLGEEDFCCTYGDGVADINIPGLIDFHRRQKTLATVTAVRPPARFGALRLQGELAVDFQEHNAGEAGWINGGFFVLSPKALDYISGDSTAWELEPMARLVKERQLSAYRHEGFWLGMDTPRDKKRLEDLWATGAAPWKVW
ncbi:MAG: glucose-1-phosphate cytidylyltransferase [bacterium]